MGGKETQVCLLFVKQQKKAQLLVYVLIHQEVEYNQLAAINCPKPDHCQHF